MKKILYLFVIFAVMFTSSINVEAKSQKCNWIWSTAVTTANDAPDYVYCQNSWLGSWKSMGATFSYKIEDRTDVRIDYQYDTTSAGANIVNGVTVCSNTSSDSDINFLLSMDNGITFDTGTGALAYYQLNDMTDAAVVSGALTPAGTNIKFTVDGDTNNACVVLRTILIWE